MLYFISHRGREATQCIVPMQKLLFFLVCILALQFSSCGNDDDTSADVRTPGGRLCTTLAYSENVQTAVDAVSTAATNYANDQSVANCNAYRASLNNWLNVVEDYVQCAAGLNQAEVQQALTEARAEIDDFEC